MRSKSIRNLIALTVIGTAIYFLVSYWLGTQPVGIARLRDYVPPYNGQIPKQNQRIVEFVMRHGKKLAPSYDQVVCTEFVIAVIDSFTPLTIAERKSIRIVTNANINELVGNDSPITKGVQGALTQSDKGFSINNAIEVRPGDFVQFWNTYYGKANGHCGIVASIEPGKSITIFSSHPLTGGFGIQKYRWPDKTYFVRLQ